MCSNACGGQHGYQSLVKWAGLKIPCFGFVGSNPTPCKVQVFQSGQMERSRSTSLLCFVGSNPTLYKTQVPEWSNGLASRSSASASQVRILPCVSLVAQMGEHFSERHKTEREGGHTFNSCARVNMDVKVVLTRECRKGS